MSFKSDCDAQSDLIFSDYNALGSAIVGANASPPCAAAAGAARSSSARPEPPHERDAMTDPTPGAAPQPAPDKPIEVKANAAPIVTQEAFKLAFTFGCVYACERLLRSDISIAAVVPAALALLPYAWAAWQRLTTWRAFRHVAERAPDDVAVVTHTPLWRFWR